MTKSRPDSFVDFRALVLEDVPTDVLAMYRVYADGATVPEVAERFARPPGRVAALFHDCGLPVARRAARKRLAELPSEVELQRAVEAERARQQRERRAAKAAARRERVMPRIRAMYALYQSGASQREVGQAFGVSESRVSQLFSWAGLPTRGAGARGQQRRGAT